MRKEEKNTIIEDLVEQISANKHFYVADIANLNAATTSKLRRKCFENKIKLVVVKNTLLKKALEKIEGDYSEIYGVLNNSSSLLLCETGNAPAKLIKEFRKECEKPILKAAYVEGSVYLGDNQLNTLVSLKSREELIGDIIGLLQSPAKNVVSALQSGKNTLAGVVKTLSERPE
ncbi:MAG TPA: 50S ribosomal protein L10 [Bacteroidales bacterium]|nr:50S ribosomal protein L10 [Bacteroidales bacterium]